MIKGFMSSSFKRQIEDELEELALIQEYMSRTNQEDEEIVSIKRRNEFVFLDGAIRVPKILMIENSSGVIEILNRSGKKGQEILTKIAEIDKNGQMNFDQDWFDENLKSFAQMGLVNTVDINFVKDIQDQEDKDNNYIQAVSANIMKKEKGHEEAERQKIAMALNVDSDEILSVIRIEDREGGSKLFNYDLEDTDKPLIVRLRNNKFVVLSEKEDGVLTEMIGYEATPVSKQVSRLLKDSSNEFTSLKPGDVKAGKTNPNQSKYDIYQIRRAGENMDDDLNNLLYVSCCGKTDMNIIESRDNGEVRFARTPQSSIYPKNIYLENNAGTPKKREVTYEEESESFISLSDIEAKRELLERLLQIESEIHELEGGKTQDEKDKLSELYSERLVILNELEITEKEAIEIQKEYDEYETNRRRPRA